MTKLRVYELAKQVGISSKKLITILEELDITVKNHMSTIDSDTAKLVVDLIEEESGKGKQKSIQVHNIEENGQPEKKQEDKKEVEQKIITIPNKISVKDLGNHMGVEPDRIIKKLMDFG